MADANNTGKEVITCKEPPYSLFNRNILPVKTHDRFSMMDYYDGKTELIEPLGVDTIDETAGRYRVVGMTSRYLANIQLTTGMLKADAGPRVFSPDDKQVLFVGALLVNKEVKVEAFGVRYYGEPLVVDIWTSRPWQGGSKGTLRDLLFDGATNTEDRIRAILVAQDGRETEIRDAEEQRRYADAAYHHKLGRQAGDIMANGFPV